MSAIEVQVDKQGWDSMQRVVPERVRDSDMFVIELLSSIDITGAVIRRIAPHRKDTGEIFAWRVEFYADKRSSDLDKPYRRCLSDSLTGALHEVLRSLSEDKLHGYRPKNDAAWSLPGGTGS